MNVQVDVAASSEARRSIAPAAPTSLAETGLEPGFLIDLMLKIVYRLSLERPSAIAHEMRLPVVLIDQLIEIAQAQKLVETLGQLGANFTAEMRWRSAGNLGVVGFFDAGYVGPEAFPDGSGEWHSGAGVGLRYATGIGPIRLDLAVPTSGASSGSVVQIYIGIGQSF